MKKYILLFLASFVSVLSYGTHNNTGEITFKCIGGLTYEAEITTYTNTLSPADRPDLTILWGDGTQDILQRYEEVYLANPELKRNRYKGTHAFAGPGAYIISFEDPSRNAGIINIPNSASASFYVQSKIIVNQSMDCNTSPVLLNRPNNSACVGHMFTHNPGASDIDGDSLSYRLVVPKDDGGLDISGYTYPQASNSFSIDSITGDLKWNSPIIEGEYTVAIQIEEWRNGVQIGYITRDMLIDVEVCSSGIENDYISYPVQVFPNPANDKLYFNSSETKNIQIEIADIAGKVLLHIYCLTNDAVDISGIAKGLYVVRILDNSKVLTAKIIIE